MSQLEAKLCAANRTCNALEAELSSPLCPQAMTDRIELDTPPARLGHSVSAAERVLQVGHRAERRKRDVSLSGASCLPLPSHLVSLLCDDLAAGWSALGASKYPFVWACQGRISKPEQGRWWGSGIL